MLDVFERKNKMSATVWIIIGLLMMGIGTYCVQHGFQLRGIEKKDKIASFEPQINQEGKTNIAHSDNVAGDKIVNTYLAKEEKDALGQKNGRVRIKLKRIFDDFKIEADKYLKEYIENSERIAGDFASRGMGTSGPHLKAHIDHAVDSKQELQIKFTKMERVIEDLLLENLDNHDLASITELSEEHKRFSQLKDYVKELQDRFVGVARSWDVKINRTPMLNDDLGFK